MAFIEKPQSSIKKKNEQSNKKVLEKMSALLDESLN